MRNANIEPYLRRRSFPHFDDSGASFIISKLCLSFSLRNHGSDISGSRRNSIVNGSAPKTAGGIDYEAS